MDKMSTAFAVLILFLCCTVQLSLQLQWRKLASSSADNATLSARRDVAIGYDVMDNRLFVFGGRGGGKILDDTWYFDFDDKNWTEVKNSVKKPQPRFTMAFGVYKRSMYIATGEGPGKVFYNDVWRFNFATMQWEQLNQGSNPPEKRYGAAGGIYPGESMLWMTHGFATKRYSNTFTYDLLDGRKKWIEEFTGTNSYNPKYPHARCVHGAHPVTPDHLIIYGGCLGGGKTGGPCPSSDTWVFSRVNKKWTRLDECMSPRMFPAIAPLPMGMKTKLRYRAVLYGGGQNRPIEDTDEKSIVWIDEAPMDEVGIFTLVKSGANDDEPDMKWERKRVIKNATHGVPMWRIGHNMLPVQELKGLGGGIIMFGGMAGGKPQNDIWFLKGDVDSVDDMDAIGDGCSTKYWSLIHFHGLLMFLGWGFFLVTGVFFARYFRHKDPLWFHIHRVCQVIGLLFTIGGFVCGVMSVPFDHFEFVHGGIGLAVFIAGLLQALNGALRPHFSKDEDKSTVRQIWEFIHKRLGRLALIFAQINISLGMFLAVVPTVVFAVWFGYLGVWLLLFFVMEIVKRRQSGHSVKPSASAGNYELNSKL